MATAPTFADYGYNVHHTAKPPDADYYPITAGRPPQSIAADNVTFQIKPTPAKCDARQPNAASSRGLQVGMGDGSVRTLSPGTSPHAFWGMVTPNGGEIIPAD